MSKCIIVGGGIVGIAVALYAKQRGHEVVIIEAGGREPGSGIETEGELSNPQALHPPSSTRISALSGTAWIWGGNSRWLDREDFDPLTLGSPSWLIERQDLEPYFEEAERLFYLGGDWDTGRFFGTSPPLGPFYRPDLYKLSPVVAHRKGRRLGVFHEVWAESLKDILILTEHEFIDVHCRGDQITAVECLHRERRITIDGDYFFLAAGGLENSRQLLLLGEAGNRAVRFVKERVGEYWCEHPHPYFGNLLFDEKGDFLRFAGAPSLPGVPYVSVMKYSLVERHRLPGPALSHTYQPVDKRGQRYLTAISEQLPLRQNKVSLSKTNRDMHGRPLLRLDYVVDRITRNRIWQSMLLFAAYLGSYEKTRLKLKMDESTFMDENFFLSGGHHHIGGTCMGRLEEGGICDNDCRLYGTNNLAILGSSVFPRGGSVNPTLNAVALAYFSFDRIVGL